MSIPILTVAFVSILGPPLADNGPDGRGGVLTVERVFRDEVEGPVSLEFTVGAVSLSDAPFLMEEARDRPRVQAEDGTYSVTRLQVVVGKDVVARLKQLGVEDASRHFYGRTVRVSGRLKRDVEAGGVGNKLITYSLVVERLDQLESVSKK